MGATLKTKPTLLLPSDNGVYAPINTAQMLGTTLGSSSLDPITGLPVLVFKSNFGETSGGVDYYEQNPDDVASGEQAVFWLPPGEALGTTYIPGKLDVSKQLQWKRDGVIAHDVRSTKHTDPKRPAGVIASNFWRDDHLATNLAMLTSGRPQLVALKMYTGQTINQFTVWAGVTTAAAGLAHHFGAVVNAAGVKLAISIDHTNEAWALGGGKTFVMTTPYVVPTDGLYWFELVVVATTVPAMVGKQQVSGMHTGIAVPDLASTADSLTDPASQSGPLSTFTASGNMFCIDVS